MRTWLGFALSLATALVVSEPSDADEATIFAAASTGRALDAVIEAYPGEAVVSYASSGTLARQIEQGAPADLFLSANPKWMTYLVEGGSVAPDAVRTYLSNTLVLIAPEGAAPLTLEAAMLSQRLDGERIAMADPEHAPVGQYGKAALGHLGLWQVAGPALARTQTTTAAVAMVARGEAVLGLTYRTDAEGVDGVQVLVPLPEDSHPPIRYPLAPILHGPEPEAAEALLDFLLSEEAHSIFVRYGFVVAGGGNS